ncbi:unnamed protein product [Dibothriocephalus latus]|uniref:Uncharacterized protein n=1 Tax=Dibothriocephalus latus TaxID=60516 RepID=A0A3P7P6B8_DIBLA|nr:unnamed protein product [Dibothriocephalus latus]
MDNICLLCRTLVEKLNLTLQRLPNLKATSFLPPPPSQSSISNSVPLLALEGGMTGVREEDRLCRGRQQAWKVLTEELVIQLELLDEDGPVTKPLEGGEGLPASSTMGTKQNTNCLQPMPKSTRRAKKRVEKQNDQLKANTYTRNFTFADR